MAVSLPDYVSMLNLKEDVTCSLVAPCLITYLHLHAYTCNSARSGISVDEGVRYSSELFCISCSPSAVTGRFRRLAKKHERLFVFQDSVLSCNSCDMLISSSTQSSHHVNLMIGSLCIERLQMCLPRGMRASVERSWKPVPKEVRGKQAAIDENSFLLASIRKIVHDDYTKKREALEASIALLDQTWESPLKEIEAMLANQMKADTRPLTPQSDEQTSGSTTRGRRKEAKVDHSAADSGHADPAKTDLLGSQRVKIREAWHVGGTEAYQRVVDLSLTVIHPFKTWVRAIFPGIANFSLDVIASVFPELRTLYRHGRYRLRHKQHVEVERTFVNAYAAYRDSRKWPTVDLEELMEDGDEEAS